MFAEDFFRKLLASSFLVQHMDSFIAQILASLDAMKRVFGSAELSRVMSYDPDLMFIPLHTSNGKLDNQVLLGSKAFFLKKMCRYDFPIPPGFVITTELHRYGNIVRSHPGIEREMDELLRYNITRLESQTGLRYGDPEAPLLFSVRSGAPMSLPGAMATFLNIGLNDEITLKLSTRPNYGWTAWDCYRRLIQSWGMAYGIDRDEFDAVMISFKRRHKVKLKTQFTPLQMRQMSESYKRCWPATSWSSNRTFSSRSSRPSCTFWIPGIRTAPGFTARSFRSPTTGNRRHHPENGPGQYLPGQRHMCALHPRPRNKAPGITLNGDFTLCSQGEDVVVGLVHTLPISEQERKQSKQKVELFWKRISQIYDRLFSLASHLLDERGYPTRKSNSPSKAPPVTSFTSSKPATR